MYLRDNWTVLSNEIEQRTVYRGNWDVSAGGVQVNALASQQGIGYIEKMSQLGRKLLMQVMSSATVDVDLQVT